ncbi:hypothetical protein BDP27DRAFT_1291170 [Rhodocollybia butyracea]|uniref:Glycopeptide n=1 Tax=Rhodocollybia butyracea TaxID=206335 RepID=A0A9P5Q0J6_9AGAR|nr:hypothetical protein BDP27DRAFT_1291170 [Rhodocollybia butyracea]
MAFTFILGLTLFLLTALVNAETHIVKFDNQCGFGTPQLIQGNQVLTTTEYTFNASYSGIAYLQTGTCGFNGEKCGTVEMTLINAIVAGGGSSADISYIPPLKYSIPYKFEFYGGCDGQGASCSSPECSEAFYTPDQTYVQVACQTDNVNILITFCDGFAASSSAASSTEPESSSSTKVPSTSDSSMQASATEATTIDITSTASAASSTSSSRRCQNRRRRIDSLSYGLRAHRHRSSVS